MDAILVALEDRYSPLTVAASIRQEASSVTPLLLNLATIGDMDNFIDQRVGTRVDSVHLNIDSAAGNFSWPFSVADLSSVYPTQRLDSRESISRMQISTAADAVTNYVLGDIYLRASKKDDRFLDQAKYYLGDVDDPMYRQSPLLERGQAGMLEQRVINSIRLSLKGADRGNDRFMEIGRFVRNSTLVSEKDRVRITTRTYQFDE